MNVFSGTVHTIVADALKSSGRITDQGDVKAQVGSHAGRRRDAVVGGKPDDDECRNAGASQVLLETGANKGTVNRLGKLLFPGQGLDFVFAGLRLCKRFQVVPDAMASPALSSSVECG